MKYKDIKLKLNLKL